MAELRMITRGEIAGLLGSDRRRPLDPKFAFMDAAFPDSRLSGTPHFLGRLRSHAAVARLVVAAGAQDTLKPIWPLYEKYQAEYPIAPSEDLSSDRFTGLHTDINTAALGANAHYSTVKAQFESALVKVQAPSHPARSSSTARNEAVEELTEGLLAQELAQDQVEFYRDRSKQLHALEQQNRARTTPRPRPALDAHRRTDRKALERSIAQQERLRGYAVTARAESGAALPSDMSELVQRFEAPRRSRDREKTLVLLGRHVALREHIGIEPFATLEPKDRLFLITDSLTRALGEGVTRDTLALIAPPLRTSVEPRL